MTEHNDSAMVNMKSAEFYYNPCIYIYNYSEVGSCNACNIF